MREKECDKCRFYPVRYRVQRVNCPSCGLKFELCSSCAGVFVACSEECRKRWRAEAAGGLPKRPVDVPTWAKVKRPEGLAVHQADMFKGAKPGVAPLC